MSSNVVHITIPSDLKYCKVLEILVRQLMKLEGFTMEQQDHVWLAYHEALINAIKHGNRHADDKRVKTSLAITVDAVRLTVEDEGEGFDPDTLSDCTDHENLCKSSGRGIHLMQHFMHELRFDAVPGKPVKVFMEYRR